VKLLFFGDLAPTGFGTVTMDLGRALLALGHDLRFVSQNEIGSKHAETCGFEHGFPCECTPTLNLPEPFASRTWIVADPSLFLPELRDKADGMDGLGQTALALASHGYQGYFNGRLWKDGWQPEACLMLGDFGNVRLVALRDEETRAAFGMVPTFHYVPIEGVDLPPTLRDMWSTIQPIAMTEFGADEIEKITGVRPPMVYHGVDSETFHPVSPERMFVIGDKKLRSKDDCKRFFHVDPSRKIILRTDRNVPRKRYAEFIRSMVPVLAARPDTVLVLHCNEFDQGGKMEDTLAKFPKVRGQVVVTNLGGRLDRPMLAALYNAADVYASNCAEGFGLTIAEALACGVPAVGLDYSAVPEVIGPGGMVSKVAALIDNEYGYFWAGADQRDLAQKVVALLDDPKEARRLGQLGTQHVRQSFSWAIAAEQMAAIMAPSLEKVA
jgi:glycosyltransferase involved in cell wall biosynthesis